MSVVAFGKGDDIAVSKLTNHGSVLGGEIIYTSPNDSRFYSRYGWNFPLDYESVPLDLHLNGAYDDLATDAVPAFRSTPNYLCVDAGGQLWKVSIAYNGKEEVKSVGKLYIHSDPSVGWWVNDDSSRSIENQMLSGFLYTDPSKKDIEKFLFEYYNTTRITWYSKSEIAKRVRSFQEKDNLVLGILDDLIKEARGKDG